MAEIVNLPLITPDDKQAPAWYYVTSAGGRTFPVIRCECKRVFSVEGTIALDGTVSREYQCRRESCGYRAYVRLAGYTKRV